MRRVTHQPLLLLVVVLVVTVLVSTANGCGCNAASRSFMDEAGVLHDGGDEQVTTTTTTETTRTITSKHSEMVLVPAGSFRMGTDDKKGYASDGEGPPRKVTLDAFWMDETEVTNAQFAKFIQDTKYVTEAETFGWSFVFVHFIPQHISEKITQAVKGAEWWLPVDGATWDHPEGPGSSLSTPFPHSDIPLPEHNAALMHVSASRWGHPVIHVSWNDAVAFCKWAGKRLPTEAEWDFDYLHICRKGRIKKKAVRMGRRTDAEWHSSYEHMARYGLYNMAGNVWEWCSDWFKVAHTVEAKVNPTGPPTGKQRVMRGGSFLCHASYCYRYRTSSRSQNTPDSSTYNLGFRCAADSEEK